MLAGRHVRHSFLSSTSCLKGFPLQWGSIYGVLEAAIQLFLSQPLSVVCLWQTCVTQSRRGTLVTGRHNMMIKTPPKYLFSSMLFLYSQPSRRFSCRYSYLGIYGPSSCSVTCACPYISSEGALLLFSVLIYCISYLIYIFGALRAAKSIHNQLIESVLGTTLRCGTPMGSLYHLYVYSHRWRWLDITPISRVIARCTRDMRASMFLTIRHQDRTLTFHSRWTNTHRNVVPFVDDNNNAGQIRSCCALHTSFLDSRHNSRISRKLVWPDLHRCTTVREAGNV